MPIVDMPLEELKNYQGRNPCPGDIDIYWENAIAEMKSVDSQVTLLPGEFKSPDAKCFDLYFTGVRGARIYAKYLRPKKVKKTPAIIQFHGYTGDSGDWCEKLQWVTAGFSVFAMDCRGQGGKSEDVGGVKGTTHGGHIVRGLDDKPENLLFRHVFLDAAQLAGIVLDMPEIDADKVGTYGVSQGGGLSLICAALEPRIKRSAAIYPFLCDYKRVWEMDLAKDAYGDISSYLRHFDPTHSREEEIFTRLGYIDCQHLASRIKSEVLMATALMDTICPPSTQFAAYNKIKSRKNMVIYPDFTHEYLPGIYDKAYEFLLAM
jgi:cephalosporin-C deacetylase